MATIFDVANWFLSKEPMSPKKVQKLSYYFKAWGLALYGDDFIPDYQFQAWIHGPVCPELYKRYKEYGWRNIPQYTGILYDFNNDEMEVLESVWFTYGNMTANALEVQTHLDDPWRKTRGNLEDYQICETLIENKLMKEFYRKVYADTQSD